jgi:hypothetical protein
MPGIEVRISIEGLDDAGELADQYAKDVEECAVGAIQDYCIDVTAAAIERAPVDTGAMQGDIAWRIEDGGKTGIVEAKKEYSLFVDQPTKPHFPPPEALAGWARRHGMPGAEYAIAKKIAARGTKGQPFISPAWERGAAEFVDLLVKRLKEKFGAVE